jgi:hypothetical protein
MTIQYATAIRNAMLDSIETNTGTAPKIRFYDGTKPATPATALSGNNLLAEGTLPSDWLADAASGSKSKSGTWSMTGQSAAGSGTAATFFRIYDNAGTTCYVQGTVTATGGGGDITLDNNSIANAQNITISSFSITEGNA